MNKINQFLNQPTVCSMIIRSMIIGVVAGGVSYLTRTTLEKTVGGQS